MVLSAWGTGLWTWDDITFITSTSRSEFKISKYIKNTHNGKNFRNWGHDQGTVSFEERTNLQGTRRKTTPLQQQPTQRTHTSGRHEIRLRSYEIDLALLNTYEVQELILGQLEDSFHSEEEQLALSKPWK
jgi:hypothetical protein